MMSRHTSELESGTADSVAFSPRSDHSLHTLHDRQNAHVRFMCSFGGKILPRPHDNQLRYVGGDTRIVAVQRFTNFSTLLTKLSKLSGTTDMNIKYQLPNEDLDALISVTSDEDVENMMEEYYDRLTHNQNHPRLARLRLFLFPNGDQLSRTSSISSLLSGSTNRDHWFLDAINGSSSLSSGLQRNQSEVSSIVSEIPDYLFGLDNSDQETQTKLKSIRHTLAENTSSLDMGSLTPATASTFCSSSSAPSVPQVPNLPPVKTRPNLRDRYEEGEELKYQQEGFTETSEPPISQPTVYSASTEMPHYFLDSRYPGHAAEAVPSVYYVPGQIPPGNVSVQPISIRAPYVHQYLTVPGQVPLNYHHRVSDVGQVYGSGMRPVAAAFEPYDVQARVVPDGVNRQVFYGVKNPGMVPFYPNMVVPGGEASQGNIVSEAKTGGASQ
ncbi:hypothetical protein F2P56_007373 [Juglans regia]|uniref:Uncharacterized protein LOC108999070 n=2 Tax=Juglans regia TaxID=51240 RepID=A0A2I4FID8_JUGRE|nr:uncharacterized protein LOC108999070 [Juglans regia]KAF5475580.1 hypothetical protein F2P56_007373 [Juglans regia]